MCLVLGMKIHFVTLTITLTTGGAHADDIQSGAHHAEGRHKKVKDLFAEYEDATPRKQQDIAETAIQELEIHAGLEEELIYPAIRKGIDDDEVMNEANEEHHLVHVLIAELKELRPSDDTFKAKFTVLGEIVKHHVKEEEGEMFPEAQKAKIDWEALKTEVMERKEQLMAQA